MGQGGREGWIEEFPLIAIFLTDDCFPNIMCLST